MLNSTPSLAPGMLLAAPRLDDPNFERSVVLLGHHDDEGAIGWILNGPSLATVREVLRDADMVPQGVVLPRRKSYASLVRQGGPVAPTSAWMLYRKTEGSAVYSGAIDLGGDYAMTGSGDSIEALGRGAGPSEFRMILGYAGWAPGQLEAEIAGGSWLPTQLDVSLLFHRDADALWGAAYQVTVGAPAISFSFGAGPRGSA